jgi:hypothetical protein
LRAYGHCKSALSGKPESRRIFRDWPLRRPRSWLPYVNQPQSEAELEAIRRSFKRAQRYKGDARVRAAVARLGLEPFAWPTLTKPQKRRSAGVLPGSTIARIRGGEPVVQSQPRYVLEIGRVVCDEREIVYQRDSGDHQVCRWHGEIAHAFSICGLRSSFRSR